MRRQDRVAWSRISSSAPKGKSWEKSLPISYCAARDTVSSVEFTNGVVLGAATEIVVLSPYLSKAWKSTCPQGMKVFLDVFPGAFLDVAARGLHTPKRALINTGSGGTQRWKGTRKGPIKSSCQVL